VSEKVDEDVGKNAIAFLTRVLSSAVDSRMPPGAEFVLAVSIPSLQGGTYTCLGGSMSRQRTRELLEQIVAEQIREDGSS
jgi:hypothetical protein